MKAFIVFALIAVAVAAPPELTEEQKAKAHSYAAVCIEQEGVTKEQAQALRDGDFTNVDDKVKCFANCFLEQAGFLKDGQIQEDVVNAKLSQLAGGEEALKNIQAKCNSLTGANRCDTAFQLYQCYREQKAAL